MSWKVEVQVGDDPKWYGNRARLPTADQAEHYADDLTWRWTSTRGYRVVETDDPVNAHWTDAGLVWDEL